MPDKNTDKKILLIGESCKDIFHYCNANRLCPDIPVPVLNIVETKTNWGMTLNVYNNLIKYVKNCDVITNTDKDDITKTRFVDLKSNHMFVRVDSDNTQDKIDLSLVKQKLKETNYDLIIVSDYNKGFLSENDIEQISHMGDVFLDTKKILDTWAKNIKIIKINNYEYLNSLKNINKHNCLKKIIIHTDGKNGCYYNGINFPVDEVDVKDSCGAGDSFLAGLAIEYLHTKNISESIKFANNCASYVVSHRGVTLIP